MPFDLTADSIKQYLTEVGAELDKNQLTGEIVLAGGALMLLVLKNREVTMDIDAYLAPPTEPIRDAARVVARRHGLRPDWLNDGVKGFFYGTPPQSLLMEMPGLRVFAVTPEYLLVMKVMASRPQDVADVKALLAHLACREPNQVLDMVAKYVPLPLIGPKVRYFVEDIMESEGP